MSRVPGGDLSGLIRNAKAGYQCTISSKNERSPKRSRAGSDGNDTVRSGFERLCKFFAADFPCYHRNMALLDCCKVCAVPPRTLARGLKRRPRCIPGLISADIRHRACFCRSARACDRRWRSQTTVRRFVFKRTAWGIFRSPPLSCQAPPSGKGRLRSPACNPIDQGREMLLSPWTVPSTNIIAVGSRPGLRIPDPAFGSRQEGPHGLQRQR